MGRFGLDEEIDRLKRDKNALIQEISRLRQQQQTTDILVDALSKRTQEIEQSQQQMMPFLSKVMHSPGFFSQLVQQFRTINYIPVADKKRKLPNQGESEHELLENHPSMLTKALTPESIAQPQNYYLPTDALDSSRISLSRSSGICFQDTLLSTRMPNALESYGISPINPCSASMMDFLVDMGFQDCAQMQGIMTDESSANVLGTSYLSFEAESTRVFPLAELETFSDDAEIDTITVDVKFPGSIDSV